ncbi:MAG: SIS domain-containing protein [Chloroflexi bacterium]|nr:SIS domain-containing protein [Chloroflexota bacterium]
MSGHIQLWQEADSGRGLLASHVEALNELVSQLDLDVVERVGELFFQAYQAGHTVYTVGNGGSAATALHIAADISWGRRMGDERRPKAISLAANTPIMTALANDVGYEDVFVEQLRGLFNPGDVVVAISASGNSENVLRVVDFANGHGGSSVGLAGFDGGKLKGMSQLCVHVATPTGAYELVEDVHHAVCHMLANYLKYRAATRSG